ncbi:DUF87 domain-containing protein [Halovenus sp. WSH3]|uniref:DUF87 domain-containing protein n=1 Tax=Halovenus carboxidivorans TaxID=2692199 RepID=A0A6B0TGR2_9EURY|nr:DUF87 domain-containing protein [Halovenus carboxidivorans]MXR52379.1 DUF87 domain-containing protein [Halovenus carboxidivorans]
MSRVDYRMPGGLNVPTQFFGQFTWKELLRIGLFPALCILLLGSTAGLALMFWLTVSLLVGLAWYGYRPFDRFLDELAADAVSWYIRWRNLEEDGFEEVSEDYVVTETGEVAAAIEVEPANLEMRTETEQQALISIYRSLFERVSYPVQIYSRQKPLSLNDYRDNIRENRSPDDVLKNDYVEHIDEFSDANLSRTRHFIVVRVGRDSQRWIEKQLRERLSILEEKEEDIERQVLLNELDSRCRDVLSTLNTGDLAAQRLEKRELENLIQQERRRNPRPSPFYTGQPKDGRGEYRKTVYVTEFPSSVEAGWLAQLQRTDGMVDVVQVIEPKSTAETSKKLQRISEKLNAEIDSLLHQGYRGTNKLEGLLEDTEWFLDLLANREDQPVDYGVYITVHSEDQETCDRTYQKVCNRLETVQIEYDRAVFRTVDAHYTDSMLYTDHLRETMLLPAKCAAAGFTFAVRDNVQENGVIYGVDTSDEAPALFDRFDWSSHSMARMGMVGSGKSYATKIEILRASLAYPNLRIIIVDPKNEYRSIARTLDGSTYTLGRDEDYSFSHDTVCFQVEERGQEENTELLVDLVQQIYAEVSQDQRKTLVVVDEVRILMNDETGRRILNRFVLEGRDTNTAVTLISQNASHFTYCREGREILDNIPGKVFMRHDRVPDSVVEYFQLSQREKQELFELKTGTDSDHSEALFKVSGLIDTRLRIEATPQEHALIEPRTEGE